MLPHTDPKDIYRGVGISIQRQSAVRAVVDPLRKFLPDAGSTPRTLLRGPARVYFDNSPTGAFSLACEYLPKHGPRRVGNGFGKTVVALHILDVEFFNGNQPEMVDQPAGGLVYKVVSAISDTLVNTSDNLVGFATLRLLLGSAGGFAPVGFALRLRQRLLVLTEEAGVLHPFAIGEGGERVQTNVYADRRIGGRQRFLLNFDSKADVPLVALPPDRAGFDPAFDSAVQDGLDGSDFGQVHALPYFINLETGLRVGETVVPLPLETGKAGFVATQEAREKGVEGKVNADRHVLQNLAEYRLDFRKLCGPLGKMFLLLVARGDFAFAFIIVPALIQEAVVHVAAHVQRSVERRFLCGCWQHSEF